MMKNIDQTLEDLRNGKFVLVFDSDSREGETDFIKAAEFCEPSDIRQMRKEGGGLIILIVANEFHTRFELPFLVDLYESSTKTFPVLKNLYPSDIPYDTKSSFSLSLNHRKTFTGITDEDRSLTIKEFSNISRESEGLEGENARELFGKNFRTPGHVPVCSASSKPLEDRFGHTEYGVALMKLADMTPVACGCEMMGDNGKALSKEEAEKYANDHGLTFLKGTEITEAWRNRK
ncbi:3,4-dihydroxy-2-butanone-4-phosphate synthase [Candidatus Altiarchaeota archaeon]